MTPAVRRTWAARRALRRDQCGFALLAVLWMVIGLSALVLGVNLVARSAIGAAQNRLAIARARWRAEGCLEIGRATIQDVLDGRASWLTSTATWTYLDRAVAAAPVVIESGCQIGFVPTGIAIDVNAANSEALRALFRGAGLPPLTSDSLADAILDWRDTGSVARPLGAKQSWYDRAGRVPPRCGPFADVRELRLVRGYAEALARVPALDTLLTTEPGRIVVARAPLVVLATLPGFGDEALARVFDMRARGVGEISEQTLAQQLSPETAKGLGGPMMQANSRIAPEPEAWIVTAHAASGTSPAVGAWIEVRLVHAGPRAAIVRRRTWP